MKVYQLRRKQVLPITLDEAWSFFSNPGNLQHITPEEMHFKILTKEISSMYPGQIIQYKIKVPPGVSMGWVTEITQVKDRSYFIDEQRFGPYSLWHHQHHFKKVEEGIEMIDIVHYALPMGILGRLAHSIYVKNQLKGIFDHRYKILEEKFGEVIVEKGYS